MAKSPTKPGGHTTVSGSGHEDPDLDSGKYRTASLARSAIARTEQITQILDEHFEENNERFEACSRDIEEVREEIKIINKHVGDLRVDMAKTLIAVRNISEIVKKDNQIRHVAMIAEVEADKAQKIAAIDDAKEAKKARRTVLLKASLIVVAALGSLLGMLIERYR